MKTKSVITTIALGVLVGILLPAVAHAETLTAGMGGYQAIAKDAMDWVERIKDYGIGLMGTAAAAMWSVYSFKANQPGVIAKFGVTAGCALGAQKLVNVMFGASSMLG